MLTKTNIRYLRFLLATLLLISLSTRVQAAARSVTVNFVNRTSFSLNLTGANFSESRYGQWVSFPPKSVNPGQTVQWKSESSNALRGVGGWTSYEIPGKGSVRMSWDNPFTGSNSYTNSAPAGFAVSNDNARGNDATVTFTLTEGAAPPPASTAARSVTVRFVNSTPHTLNLIGRKFSEGDNGRWLVSPPQSILPGQTVEWKSESSQALKGVGGSVNYEITGKGSVYLGWENPFIGSNSYTNSAPAGFAVSNDDARGNHATVTFRLIPPSQLLKVSIVNKTTRTLHRSSRDETRNDLRSGYDPPVLPLDLDQIGRREPVLDPGLLPNGTAGGVVRNRTAQAFRGGVVYRDRSNAEIGFVLRWTKSLEPDSLAQCETVTSPGFKITYTTPSSDTVIFTITEDASPAPAPTPAPRPTPTPTSISAGKYVFVSNASGNEEIYSQNEDGTSRVKLTNEPSQDLWPSWSPDGTQIVFASNRGGSFQIYKMNADGSGVTQLTRASIQAQDPEWSPDGSKIAFYSQQGGNFDIYVMNADGSNQVRLTTNSLINKSPSWSPDGRKIVFTSNRDAGGDTAFQIYVMNADGTGQTRLTNNASGDFAPDWSPDGRKIAFQSGRDGRQEIYVMNPDGTSQTRLTSSSGGSLDPCWTTNGDRIVFTRVGGGTGVVQQIRVITKDGGDAGSFTGADGVAYNFVNWAGPKSLVTSVEEAFGIGIATWASSAEFSAVTVNGTHVLVTKKNGVWSAVNNTGMRQTDSKGFDLRALGTTTPASSYTIELRARRIQGLEGFLIMFAVRGDHDHLRWSIGGWTNTKHAIQRTVRAQTTTVVETPGNVNIGQWYRIKIEYREVQKNGRLHEVIKCYLDGTLIHNIDQPKP